MTTTTQASDTDRQRVVAALEQHTAAGRLTLSEFASRAGAACRAETLEELAALLADLPPPTSPRASGVGGPDTNRPRIPS
jgi:hypothetical protein